MGIDKVPDYKELLIQGIAESPQNIEREFGGEAGNSWLACVNTRLQLISGYLTFSTMNGQISSEEEGLANEKLQKIIDRVRELQIIYPKKENVPPKEIKNEILAKLDILK
jgi:hypothetical protein